MESQEQDVTQKMMDWVIAELRFKAKLFKTVGAVSVYNGDVVKSDKAISAELKASLRNCVHVLENIPEVYKDYHPGSDGKVLDIVHPSLFPLIYGQSRILEHRLVGMNECVEIIGTGTIIQIRPDEEMELDRKAEQDFNQGIDQPNKPYSKHFQWLPCEIDISNASVRYVNQLEHLNQADLSQDC